MSTITININTKMFYSIIFLIVGVVFGFFTTNLIASPPAPASNASYSLLELENYYDQFVVISPDGQISLVSFSPEDSNYKLHVFGSENIRKAQSTQKW